MATPDSTPVLDPERQQRARVYARLQRRLLVVELALGAVYAGLWLGLGLGAALGRWLATLTPWPWLQVAGFAFVFGGLYGVISFPLDYYSGFVLQHRFELSVQSLRDWLLDQLKGVLIAGPIGLVLLEVIYAVLRVTPDFWWLWSGGIIVLFNVVLGMLAPVVIMPLFNKFVPLGEEHAELAARLMALADRAGAHVEGVYKFDMSRRTTQANAALTGLGKTRRIVLGDTLLDSFTADEIETVLAHELGHHVHRDIPVGIVIEGVLTLVGLYLAAWGLRWGTAALGLGAPGDAATLPLFSLLLGAYGLVTMPLGNWYSRWRECRADDFALELTGKGTAFAEAFTRLANQNLAEVDPEPWVEFLLYSHPALHRRIARAQAWGKKAA